MKTSDNDETREFTLNILFYFIYHYIKLHAPTLLNLAFPFYVSLPPPFF